jgi:hypothetical protein
MLPEFRGGGPHDGRLVHPRHAGVDYVCVKPGRSDEHHLYLPDGEHFRYAGRCTGAEGTPVEHPHWDIEAAT